MKKRLLSSCLLISLLFCLSACGGSEPEQVYLVSAVGFDGDGDGVTLSVEVPVSRAGDSKGLECKLFVGRGARVEDALREVTAGLSRELFFGHCALMVLGEGLSAEQSDEAFEFASSEVFISLAAQVVFTPNAKALLEGGGLSSPAAGYDLPAILRETEGLLGIRTHSQIYELRANASPDQPTLLPYFLPSKEEDPQAAVFGGLAILRRGQETVLLEISDCVPYAILADLFFATDGAAGSFGGGTLRMTSSRLFGKETAEGLAFSMEISLYAERGVKGADLQALRTEIEETCVNAFYDLRARCGADVLFFRDRAKGLGAMDEAEYARLFATSTLSVSCLVSGKEGEK